MNFATRLGSILYCLLFATFSGAALAQVPGGVQQSAAQTANITGIITQGSGQPVVGANVRLNGSAAIIATKTDSHGLFLFTSVPFGTYNIVVTSELGVASRNSITLRGDINVAIQYQSGGAGLKIIAQTTTHINITPANIASVSPSDYAFEGNASWQKLLDRIPGVTVGGLTAGGESTADSIPGAPQAPIVLTINGTLPYETSTMLDGMPIEGTSGNAQYTGVGGGTDLSVLPLNGFDAADVVRGPGADSPSIVDSVGGTFALHAPGVVDHDQYELSVSNDVYGGVIANAKAALNFGRLSATITYGLNDSPGPFGKTNTTIIATTTPQTINGQPFQGCTTPAACWSIVPSTGPYQNCFCSFQNSLIYCCPQISTEWTALNGAMSLAYKVGSSITAQVFYAGSSSTETSFGDSIPVDFVPAPGYTGVISPGAHAFPNTEGQVPFSQSSSLLEEKITAFLGRGVLRLSALRFNSFSGENLGGPSLPNGQYSLFGSGFVGATAPGTLTFFNGSPVNVTFGSEALTYKTWSNNRDLLGSYAIQLGNDLNAGISYSTSYYNEPYVYDLTCPAFVFDTGQPNSIAERTNEYRVNVNDQISDKLSLSGSWYFATGGFHVPDPTDPVLFADSIFHYSAPRFGAVWHANRNVAIRVAAGGGFALPQLFNLVGISSLLPIPGISAYELIQPNLNLQPEKSFGVDLGTDVRLRHDTVLSFDLYNTNLYGQFFISTRQTGTFLGAPLYTQEYVNLAQSRFQGINLDIHHDPARGIYWRAAVGLTRAYVVSVPPGFYNSPASGPISTNTYVVANSNFDGYFQSTVPYANGTSTIGYRWSAQKYVDLDPTYYGNNNAYFEPAFLEFDAHGSYPLGRGITLQAIFRNIGNIHGQNFETLVPSLGAPTIGNGGPMPLFGIPYGSRGVTVTLNYKY